ncbi:MAG TPA: hypothetical protein VID51_07895 [Solirubrobacterales bacterium]|jgi:hypothetical protein
MTPSREAGDPSITFSTKFTRASLPDQHERSHFPPHIDRKFDRK